MNDFVGYGTSRPRLKSDFKSVTQADPQGYLVLAIVLVIFVIVLAWIWVQVDADSKPTDVIQRCPVGLCAFSTTTGIKRCPANGAVEGLRIAPGQEFCTSRDYCQQEPFTCAVLPDQTIDCGGDCGVGNAQCRCISNPLN